jgi:CspA family cold shock protein
MSEAEVTQSGLVKFYDPQRGFGFIAPDSGTADVFFHATVLQRSGLEIVEKGERLKFTVGNDNSGRIRAVTVQPE